MSFIVLSAFFTVSIYRTKFLGIETGFADIILERGKTTIEIYDYAINYLLNDPKYLILGYYGGIIHLAIFSSIIKSIPGPNLGPRTLIGDELFGIREVSTTSTLLTPIILDFGLIGMVILLSFYALTVSSLYFYYKKSGDLFILSLYSFLMSYLIIGIETGILDINIFLTFLISFIIIRFLMY